jgi:hypothetical protein
MDGDKDVEARDAFCMGFFARCVEEGLSKEAAEARLEKLSQTKSAVAGIGAVLRGTGRAFTTGAVLPALVGLGLGGVAGYGAAQVTAPDADPEAIRAQEIANTYKLYAQRAAAKRRLRSYRPSY